MTESMRYVRAYPAELPALRDLLPQIQTAVQIIAGARTRRCRRSTLSSCTTGCPTASSTSSTPGTSPRRTQPTSTRRWSPPGGPAATRPPAAKQIVRWIEATGENLTTIDITHGHGDHDNRMRRSQGASS